MMHGFWSHVLFLSFVFVIVYFLIQPALIIKPDKTGNLLAAPKTKCGAVPHMRISRRQVMDESWQVSVGANFPPKIKQYKNDCVYWVHCLLVISAASFTMLTLTL